MGLDTDAAPEQFIDCCIIRTARKPWRCDGDGAAKSHRKHSEFCCHTIQAHERYVEYVGEAAPYESGYRVCWDCAQEFLTR